MSVLYNTILFLIGINKVFASSDTCYFCMNYDESCANGNKNALLSMSCNDYTISNGSLSNVKISDLVDDPFALELLEEFDAAAGPIINGANNVCVTLGVSRNNNNLVFRTCAPNEIAQDNVCAYLETAAILAGGEPKSCKTCVGANCNSANAKFTSTIALLFLFITIIFRNLL